MKEYTIQTLPSHRLKWLLFAVICLGLCTLLIFYLEERVNVIKDFEKLFEFKTHRTRLRPKTSISIFLYLIVVLLFLLTCKFSHSFVIDNQPEGEVRLKLSKQGIWNKQFGLIPWSQIEFITIVNNSLPYIDSADSTFGFESGYMIIGQKDAQKQYKIDISRLDYSINMIKAYMAGCNTNSNLRI